MRLLAWVRRLAVAEAVGMTAAAATASTHLVGGPARAAEVLTALVLLVTGGLVEGLALGVAEAGGLAERLPALRRTRWVQVTVAVAGLGWAAGSLPGVLAGEGDGEGSALGLVLLGAAGLGLALGAALGAAQAVLLRGLVARPARWAAANALAWPPAMAVIFLGATAPGAAWPLLVVLLTGSVTGAAAGAVLGLVTGLLLPWVAAGEVRPAVPARPASRGAAGDSSPTR